MHVCGVSASIMEAACSPETSLDVGTACAADVERIPTLGSTTVRAMCSLRMLNHLELSSVLTRLHGTVCPSSVARAGTLMHSSGSSVNYF
jgi:hypothetical protein